MIVKSGEVVDLTFLGGLSIIWVYLTINDFAFDSLLLGGTCRKCRAKITGVEREGFCTKMATNNSATAGLKIRIRLKAYDHRIIDRAAKDIVGTAVRTGATVSGPVPLPTRRSTFTVVKSPHVYKTGGEAFEMKVHKRLIDITNATPKTIDSLQNLALPAGVDAEIKM